MFSWCQRRESLRPLEPEFQTCCELSWQRHPYPESRTVPGTCEVLSKYRSDERSTRSYKMKKRDRIVLAVKCSIWFKRRTRKPLELFAASSTREKTGSRNTTVLNLDSKRSITFSELLESTERRCPAWMRKRIQGISHTEIIVDNLGNGEYYVLTPRIMVTMNADLYTHKVYSLVSGASKCSLCLMMDCAVKVKELQLRGAETREANSSEMGLEARFLKADTIILILQMAALKLCYIKELAQDHRT
ncbi:hypothetical protein STEG23_035477, partial [Scotinomys teguina]